MGQQTEMMSMEHTYSKLSRATVAFAVVAGAACASSGTSAGTYMPPVSSTTVIVNRGGSWVGEPSGVHVNVDLSERKLYLKNGDEVVRAYEIGVGQAAYPTPEGNYTVRRIVWNPPWTPPDEAWAANKEPQQPGAAANPMKVVKIYFNEPDYYIHGTGSVSTLGGAVSHGCLRMAPEDAASLARYLMEHGGEARDASWFQRVQGSNETVTITLDNSIPMHVGQ